MFAVRAAVVVDMFPLTAGALAGAIAGALDAASPVPD